MEQPSIVSHLILRSKLDAYRMYVHDRITTPWFIISNGSLLATDGGLVKTALPTLR
jgi:hypothetical protein